MRNITRTVLFLLFSSLLFSGCAKDTLTGVFVGSDQEEQSTEREIKQDDLQIVAVFKGKHSLQEPYAHPITIPSETIEKVMQGIRFQIREYPDYIKTEKSEWSIPTAVFQGADLATVASGISRLLSQITPKEEIYFYIEGKHRVEGKTYLTSDGWYWYFRTIDGKRPKHDRVSNIREWKIHLQKGESYIVSETGYELKRVNVNWISIPLSKQIKAEIQKKYQSSSEKNVENYKIKREYSTGSKPQERHSRERTQQNTEVIDKKILILDKLKEDGIITQEEYQIKVQEILRNEL